MKSRLILASIIFGIIIISNLNHVFAYDERITVSPILKERLAKGELTLQDFQELKKEISS